MKGKSRIGRTAATAAMAGLMYGSAAFVVGCQHHNNDNNNPGMSSSTNGTSDTAAMGKHDCKGKNDCKGQGGCKTSDNGCRGKNSCKGKGGCNPAHATE